MIGSSIANRESSIALRKIIDAQCQTRDSRGNGMEELHAVSSLHICVEALSLRLIAAIN